MDHTYGPKPLFQISIILKRQFNNMLRSKVNIIEDFSINRYNYFIVDLFDNIKIDCILLIAYFKISAIESELRIITIMIGVYEIDFDEIFDI